MKSANRIWLALCLCLLDVMSGMAQLAINGQCVDEKEQPLAGVNVVVFAATDTTHVLKGAVSNAEGRFSCDNLSAGDYVLRFSMVGFQTLYAEQSLQKDIDARFVLREDSEIIDEVVVTATMLKSFGNRDEIFLRKENLEVGNNALDAISSLPQFSSGGLSNELTTIDQKSVLIVIDGKRASSLDLQTMQAEDIKKLNYYSEPPARYANENIDAVLEVITKRPKERKLTAYIDTRNGVTTGYGTNIINLGYTDSLNQFSAYYYFDYRALNDNRMNNKYQYADYANDYMGKPGSYKGQYHIARLTYQRYQGSNLFNAKFTYRKNPGHEKYEQDAISRNADEQITGLNSRNLESDYDSWSLDLYYSKNFTDTRSLSVNAVNTYYTSNSDNTLSRVMDGRPEWNYAYENLFKNKSYSLIAEAVYSDKLWNGDWYVGANFRCKNLNQRFNGTSESDLSYNRSYFYTEYANQWKKLSYSIDLGAENVNYHTVSGDSYHFWVFRPYLSLNYGFSKLLSLRLRNFISSQIPDIGYLTDNIVSIDEHYFTKGNTTLKPYYYNNTQLSLQYSSADNKLYISPSIIYEYQVHPYGSLLSVDGENIVRQYGKWDHTNVIGANFTGSWNPVKWLTFQPYYTYYQSRYETAMQKVRNNMHRVGANLILTLNEFEIWAQAAAPFTLVDGDVYTKKGMNTYLSVLWKHNNFSLGADWLYYPSSDRTYANIPNFQLEEELVWHNLKYLCTLSFTYYFSTGKARQHAGKRINNSDSDSGLIKANTAK